jgi:ribosome maturation factor RimP
MPAGGEMSGLRAHFLFGAKNGPSGSLFRRKFSMQEPRLLSGVGTMAAKLDLIRSAAERVAASHGLDVVDLEFIGPAKERTLRIYLEKNAEGRAKLKAEIEAAASGEGSEVLPERLVEGTLKVEQLSGVTHEDCAAFSRDFGVLLDVEDLVPGAEYTLEASSPGLDRKLAKAEEFIRFAGCLVKVQTFEAIRNNRHWQGRLIDGASAGSILLDLAAVKQNSKSRKAGVSTVEIALANIEKAQLVPEI